MVIWNFQLGLKVMVNCFGTRRQEVTKQELRVEIYVSKQELGHEVEKLNNPFKYLKIKIFSTKNRLFFSTGETPVPPGMLTECH